MSKFPSSIANYYNFQRRKRPSRLMCVMYARRSDPTTKSHTSDCTLNHIISNVYRVLRGHSGHFSEWFVKLRLIFVMAVNTRYVYAYKRNATSPHLINTFQRNTDRA
jgi:hypothetical protein